MISDLININFKSSKFGNSECMCTQQNIIKVEYRISLPACSALLSA